MNKVLFIITLFFLFGFKSQVRPFQLQCGAYQLSGSLEKNKLTLYKSKDGMPKNRQEYTVLLTIPDYVFPISPTGKTVTIFADKTQLKMRSGHHHFIAKSISSATQNDLESPVKLIKKKSCQ